MLIEIDIKMELSCIKMYFSWVLWGEQGMQEKEKVGHDLLFSFFFFFF